MQLIEQVDQVLVEDIMEEVRDRLAPLLVVVWQDRTDLQDGLIQLQLRQIQDQAVVVLDLVSVLTVDQEL
jgi:hypothetical protein